MRLLWTVGRRDAFLDGGAIAVGTRSRRRERPPAWSRELGLIAACAGLLHDLGKYNEAFQTKLVTSATGRDPIRHEWLSTHLVAPLRQGKPFDVAWAEALRNVMEMPLRRRLADADDVLRYVVATHHKLPNRRLDTRITTGAYIDPEHQNVRPAAVSGPGPRILRPLHATLARLNLKADPRPDAEEEGVTFLRLRALALLARAALVLADHHVSSRNFEGSRSGVVAWANTEKRERLSGAPVATPGRVLDQPLEWHLGTVSDVASRLASRMHDLDLPGLQPDSRDRVERRAGKGRFEWQDGAARALGRHAARSPAPTLVFNLSGTGTGKTRMNLRALSVLRTEGPLRVAVALNLRTLTLQTGDVYSTELGIPDDELAVVIGDRATVRLHRQATESDTRPEDEGEGFEDPGVDAFGEEGWLPRWISDVIDRPKEKAVIGAPLLVSTTDWLIAAGEPQRQGRHARALLRMMSSDLVLDEIDSYDPAPLVANLRLVHLCGLFGRHVVLSSATLPPPVANAAWRAFEHGSRMRRALIGENAALPPALALIGSDASPVVLPAANAAVVAEEFRTFRAELFRELPSRRHRLVEMVEPDAQGGEDAWMDAVVSATHVLHRRHRWAVETPSGERALSIGLVRVANIRTAIPLARRLSVEEGGVAVCCYHSNHLLLQRAWIERHLDQLLKRRDGVEDLMRIASHPVVKPLLDSAPSGDLCLIVVATPVEEIGRDHDFDWAVVEPSSAHSIVQTAGRVNRHRRVDVERPNVMLMQRSMRETRRLQRGTSEATFKWPGLESDRMPYDTHELKDLVDEEVWLGSTPLDARLTDAEVHRFAALDQKAMKERVEVLLEPVLDGNEVDDWIALETYIHAQLRERSPQERWILALDESDFRRTYFLLQRDTYGKESPVKKDVRILDRTPHDWLVLDSRRLLEELEGSQLESEIAFAVNLTVRRGEEARPGPMVVHDLSFGFRAL